MSRTTPPAGLDIREKWALVTGAGRGIGRAVAVALAGEGARVALTARNAEQLEETAAACLAAGAAQARVLPADLSEPSEVDYLVARLREQAGEPSVLVNNAGVAHRGRADAGDPDEWDRMIAVNLSAPMRLTRHFAPSMMQAEEGLIVNVGSIAGVEPMQSSGAYAATKHGLRGWSLSCYQALRFHNIKVVLINPAFVRTSLVSGNEGVIPERMIEPEDIAECVKLALRTSANCCPQEITLRLTRSAYAER